MTKRSFKSNMISPVSSSSTVPQSAGPTAQSKPQQASSSEPQDTVQLGAKAQAMRREMSITTATITNNNTLI
jgi:hypothetical protein